MLLKDNRTQSRLWKLPLKGVNTRDWIDSDEDRDYWKAIVNAALNLWFHRPWISIIIIIIIIIIIVFFSTLPDVSFTYKGDSLLRILIKSHFNEVHSSSKVKMSEHSM